MRKLLVKSDRMFYGRFRLITRAWEVEISDSFPEGREFAFQLLEEAETCYQIARIDNQLHRGRPGVHVHWRGRVMWRKMTLWEAETFMKELIERMAHGTN